MTKTELSRFQHVVTTTIVELEQLIRHRDGIRVESSADELEEIQHASGRVLAVSNLVREISQLRNARVAISRIHEGSFGKCQQGDEDNHRKRLTAVPGTRFCIRCQEICEGVPEEMQTGRDFREAVGTIA